MKSSKLRRTLAAVLSAMMLMLCMPMTTLAEDAPVNSDENVVVTANEEAETENDPVNSEENVAVDGDAADFVITEVTVNVDTTMLPTELVAGEEPDTNSAINAFSVPVDANYSIIDFVIGYGRLDIADVYVTGVDYYFWMLIKPSTDYSFDENVTASSADGKLITFYAASDGFIVGYPIGTAVMNPNYVPDGYTSDTNKMMAYRYNSYGFDIQGKFNGNWRPTTYDNDGYFTKVKVGDDVYDVSAAPFASAETLENGLKVGIDLDFVNNGNQLKIVYTVENTGEEAINYALASGADVQIGDDDGAVITPFSDAMGFKMVSRGGDNDDDYPLDHYTKHDGTEDYAQFNFFGDSKYSGVTGVSALWYGYYNHVYDDTELFEFGEADCQTAADGEYLDSGMIWRWDNNTIGAGDTQTFSILIGIGGAGSENVVPIDPEEPIEVPVEEEIAVLPSRNDPAPESAFTLVLTNNTKDKDHKGTLATFAKRIKNAPEGTEFLIDAGNNELVLKTAFMRALIKSGNILTIKSGDLTFVIDSNDLERVKVINLNKIKKSEECKKLAETTDIIYISVNKQGKIILSAEKPE